jgi:hypothetical protein
MRDAARESQRVSIIRNVLIAHALCFGFAVFVTTSLIGVLWTPTQYLGAFVGLLTLAEIGNLLYNMLYLVAIISGINGYVYPAWRQIVFLNRIWLSYPLVINITSLIFVLYVQSKWVANIRTSWEICLF